MVYRSDEIPLDIGFSFTHWPAASALCVLKLWYNQIVLSWYKSTFPIFKNGAYFSVTSIALNDVNVSGGNAIKPFVREIGTGQKFVSL